MPRNELAIVLGVVIPALSVIFDGIHVVELDDGTGVEWVLGNPIGVVAQVLKKHWPHV
jgi:hypothetical protein